MIIWYNREGKQISDMHEVEELLRNPDYKIIKQETTPTGYWVSTVWLGLDHRLGALDGVGKPLIFETMVFGRARGTSDMDINRYSTETEALIGHVIMVEKWSSKWFLFKRWVSGLFQ